MFQTQATSGPIVPDIANGLFSFGEVRILVRIRVWFWVRAQGPSSGPPAPRRTEPLPDCPAVARRTAEAAGAGTLYAAFLAAYGDRHALAPVDQLPRLLHAAGLPVAAEAVDAATIPRLAGLFVGGK